MCPNYQKFIMKNMSLLVNLRDVELNTKVMTRVRKACMTLPVRVELNKMETTLPWNQISSIRSAINHHQDHVIEYLGYIL